MFEMEQIGRPLENLARRFNMNTHEHKGKAAFEAGSPSLSQQDPGVTDQAVYNWERGMAIPDVQRLNLSLVK